MSFYTRPPCDDEPNYYNEGEPDDLPVSILIGICLGLLLAYVAMALGVVA